MRTNILGTMRVAELLAANDLCSAQDISDALSRVRTDLASGTVDLEKYIADVAVGTPYQEVLAASDNEEQGTCSNGLRMCTGDFLVTYAHPALVYGIALGLCISEGGVKLMSVAKPGALAPRATADHASEVA